MLFELTNEQRKYVGLTQVEESWERTEFKNDTYLYFNGDQLVKKIVVTENTYHEIELNEKTAENRTVVLPKTPKGKIKKLNHTALQSMSGIGVYFAFHSQCVKIANYSTQTTFYSSDWDQEKIEGLNGLKKWLNWWIKDTSENDMKDIELFRSSVRQHCTYKEGDFFAFKSGRRQYGFGRILLDVTPIRNAVKKGTLKEKHYGLMQLMGKPLIIKIYKKTSNTMEVDFNELKQCEAYFSVPIMDNVFYYGEYKILGNQPLEPPELEFPISYSRSISAIDSDMVYLQYGLIYKETHISNYDKYLKDPNKEGFFALNPFRYESIGYGFSPIVKDSDLRNPQNADIKREIFEHFGLDANKSYYENYEEYRRER